MYKITIKNVVGDLVKETTIETDDLELIIQILTNEEVLKVQTDTPNQSIDDNWQKLQKIWEDAQTIPKPYVIQPYPPGSPSLNINNPFTTTC